jgi:farnesyl-diphosphate farnesyltransferase
MALLTLRKIKQTLDFKESTQVKITRRSVKATILVTKFTGRNNYLLSLIFNWLSHDLKAPNWHYKSPPDA